MDSKRNTYFEEINLFRGLAIFAIILGHVEGCVQIYTQVNWEHSWLHILDMLRSSYGSSGSWYFVFISGFLFHSVFYVRGIVYKKFLKGKFIKVFVPYFIFVSIYIILALIYRNPSALSSNFFIYAFFYQSFWYIPFISFMFICTPIFEIFISLKSRSQIIFLLISIFVAIGIGRHSTNPILGCLYYTPGYLLGIMISLHYAAFKNIEWKKKFTFTIFYLILLTVLVSLGLAGRKNYDTWVIDFYSYPCGMVLIKLSLCIIFLWILLKIREFSFYRFIRYPLNLLAKYSFTIFFFQQYAIFHFEMNPPNAFFAGLTFWQAQLVYWLAAIAFCFLTIIIFAPIKKLLGKHSRMIIGS